MGKAYLTGPLSGPVIGFLFFLERSRDPRCSLGAACAIGDGVVSIASCVALDRRSSERCVRCVGFVTMDGAFDSPRTEVDGTSLASLLPWLLLELAEASGVAELREGRAALAAPTVGASGVSLGTLGVVRVTAKGRCGGAPWCTTSAKDNFRANNEETRCLASRKVKFSLTFTVIISFSFFQTGQDLEYAACPPLQFAQLTSSSSQFSVE